MIATGPSRGTENLSGVKKAAMLLILLGDKVGGELVRHLSEEEVQNVSREVARLESIPADQAESLLEEFYQMNRSRDFGTRGGIGYARKMLMSAFGSEAATRMVEGLSNLSGSDYENLDILQKADPRQIAQFIQSEHPQTIALILSHLGGAQAAALLLSLPPELRTDVALRMASLDQISPEVVNKITAVIGQKLQSIGEFNRESYGGIRAVAEMLNRLDAGTSEEMLDVIETQNPNLVESIRHLMFVFEDLLLIDVNQLKEIMSRVDRKILTYALKGTSEQLRDHFFSTMSGRATDMMKDDMEALGPVRIKEVESAQQQVIAIVRQLEADGVISMGGSGGEQYVV